jgi:hypothetical protein
MPVPLREVNALPFEIWREEGVIRLIFTRGACIDVPALKELLRVLGAVDPAGTAPVLVEQEERAHMYGTARELLRRIQHRPARPVAFMAYDLEDRVHGAMLGRVYNERFPFRSFVWKEEALRWLEGWLRSPHLRVLRGGDRG